MSFHQITETAHGLQLEVEGSEVALIRQRGGALDLVFQVRGPMDLERARRTLVGLIDLVIAFDALPVKLSPTKSRKD